MKEYRLSQLAEQLGLKLQGEDAVVKGVNTLEAAGEDEISFLANPKYGHFLATTRACAVIVDKEHAPKVKRALVSDSPYMDFGRTLMLFARPEGSLNGISNKAFIDPTAQLSPDCTVYPGAFIGPRTVIGSRCVIFPGAYVGEDCSMGEGSQLYPNAVLLSRVKVGKNCILQPGVVIGAEGFGFTRAGGGIMKIPQTGFVELADGVEIGPNSTVDRGALGPTTVGKDTKIDNLVQIGHNVQIGNENLVVAQVGVAGSTRTGDRVTMAGQVGISGHLKIGNDVTLGPKAGVIKDVPDGFTGSGAPLMEGQTFLRWASISAKLPDLYKRFLKLEKELAVLKQQLEDAKEQ